MSTIRDVIASCPDDGRCVGAHIRGEIKKAWRVQEWGTIRTIVDDGTGRIEVILPPVEVHVTDEQLIGLVIEVDGRLQYTQAFGIAAENIQSKDRDYGMVSEGFTLTRRQRLIDRLKFWQRYCPICGYRMGKYGASICGMCVWCCAIAHHDLTPLQKMVHDEVTT